MSSKKIGYWESQEIAQRVAAKAFEHLFTPLENKFKDIASRAYSYALVSLDMTSSKIATMKDMGIVDYSETCNVRFGTAFDGEDVEFTLKDGTYISRHVNINNSDFIIEATVAWPEYHAMFQKRASLHEIVRQQISGKTTATVKKNWPEIAGFVDDVLGTESFNDMTIPFERLLARFLPALPAPV